MENIVYSKKIYDFFKERSYKIINPFHIVNNKDTLFYSAGIQPLLTCFNNNEATNIDNLFIAQPVIRTQYVDSLSEGYSLAFVNGTTAKFNLSGEDYKKLVCDWMEFFQEIGLDKKRINQRKDFYIDNWNGMNLSGDRTFYYYDNIEIGDTTFFTKTDKKGIDSMCDLGFGLERLRWVLDTNKSYYDLYSDSKNLNPREKALISAISLLAVCEIAPSQKSCGYRVRLFSKKLAETLNTRKLSINELNYFKECIEYWNDWMRSKKILIFLLLKKNMKEIVIQ